MRLQEGRSAAAGPGNGAGASLSSGAAPDPQHAE